MEEEAKQGLLLFHLALRILWKWMFFCKVHYLCLPQSTYNTQSSIRDTELLKCKEVKLKEGIFLLKQGNNRNGTVTFCVSAALMYNSNCSVFTDSKIDQILIMPSYGGIQRPKALNANAASLNWICEKLDFQQGHLSLWEDTFYHRLLTWKIPQEHIHYCQVLMESGRNWREIALPSPAVLSSCFMVISSWGQVLMTNCRIAPTPVWLLSLVWGPR